MNSSEFPKVYRGREQDLTQELLAYFQHAASTIDDAERLEELLDELCSSDETLLTNVQAELRQRQAQYVRNLLKEKSRMDALREVYFDAMDEARAVGGAYYRDTATQLTQLEAEGFDALEHQQYHTFTRLLEAIRTMGERAKQVLENANSLERRTSHAS